MNELKKALNQMAEERHEPAPGAEELLAYHDGELSEDEERALQERFLFDRDAIQTLLDLEGIPDAAGDDKPEELEAAWQDFEERLQQRESGSPSSSGRLISSRLLLWTNVALLLLSVGLAFQLSGQKRLRERLMAPNLEGPVVELMVDGVETRDALHLPVLDQEEQTLAFRLSARYRNYPYFTVQILAQETVLFSEKVAGPQEQLSLHLRKDWFKEGPFEVVLSGERDGKETELARYILQLNPAD